MKLPYQTEPFKLWLARSGYKARKLRLIKKHWNEYRRENLFQYLDTIEGERIEKEAVRVNKEHEDRLLTDLAEFAIQNTRSEK